MPPQPPVALLRPGMEPPLPAIGP
uniref:Uncharacterized protein n=1 Tax=Arundo donax TaxID=35708 RepID=A0A0A8ZG26_ARUDO